MYERAKTLLAADWVRILFIVVLWRVVLGALFAFAAVTIPPDPSVTVGAPPPSPIWATTTARWDGGYYQDIAENGYGTQVGPKLAFFPLFPLLVRGVHTVTGLSSVSSGVVVNFVAAFFACWFLFLLAREFTGSREKAIWCVLLFLFFPKAFFLAAFYTEAVFCALVFGSFWFARQQRWWLASLLCAAGTAARLPGVVVCVCLFIEYAQSRGFRLKKFDAQVLWLLVSPLGAVLFFRFLKVQFGRAFWFSELARAYWPYHIFSLNVPNTIFVQLDNAWSAFREGRIYGWFLYMIPLFAWCGALVVTALKIRRLPWSYSAFVFLSLIVFAINSNLVSADRYVLTLFPVFLVVGHLFSAQKLGLIVGLSALMMGETLVMFSALYWAG